MLLTNKNTTRLGIQKRTLQRSIRFGPISLKFITLLLLSTLFLAYIAVSAEGASKSYKVYGLNREVEELTKEQDWLTAEANRLKTIKEADRAAQVLGLEPIQPKDVSYDSQDLAKDLSTQPEN
jgi:cell division protein FtsB